MLILSPVVASLPFSFRPSEMVNVIVFRVHATAARGQRSRVSRCACVINVIAGSEKRLSTSRG